MFSTRHLTRNYSLASLIGIGVAAMLIVLFYQSMAVHMLLEREGKANGELAQSIANHVWPRYADYFWFAGDSSAEQLAALPVVAQLHQEIMQKLHGLRITTVKVYDTRGLVVYSTEARQIGTSCASCEGVRQALDGNRYSELVTHQVAVAPDNGEQHRNLIATYIPVQRNGPQPVEGVFEIYADVTGLLQDINKAGTRILIITTALMLLLYLFLLAFIRSASRLIEQHEAELRYNQQQRIDYLEHHDEQTGLFNRKGLLRQLLRYGQHSPVRKEGLGVVALRLDNLTTLSSGLGQKRTSQLICMVAERLSRSTSPSCSLSRLDNHVFVLVVEHLFTEMELEFVTSKIVELFATSFDVDGRSIHLTVAIGYDASWENESGEIVLSNALLALDEEQAHSGHAIMRYTPDMELHRLEHSNLEIDLSQALRGDQFMLYYQPKVTLADGRVSSMEALLRWQHPRHGLIQPQSFIPMLEQRGYITEMSEWLLREACTQCRRMRDSGHHGLRVAVNISLKQLLAANFIDVVTVALHSTALAPQALELELTESILIEDMERICHLFSQLRAIGVVLSIDDFGTGYSGLSYLSHLPLDYIKIDRSFIHDIPTHRDHAVLTGTIITLAKSLGLKVVAEGVESAEQLAMIREMECDEVQGYYYSPPVHPSSISEVVARLNQFSPLPVPC